MVAIVAVWVQAATRPLCPSSRPNLSVRHPEQREESVQSAAWESLGEAGARRAPPASAWGFHNLLRERRETIVRKDLLPLVAQDIADEGVGEIGVAAGDRGNGIHGSRGDPGRELDHR